MDRLENLEKAAKFESYKQVELDGSWDAIVIGSGIGGLSTAAMLAMHAGKRVLVLERHYEAGGFTHTFKRPGFQWDVGVHYIGGMGDERSMVKRIFDHLTGGRVEWAAMPDVYDRVVIGDRSYDFVRGVERFRARMKEYFPNDAQAIDRYISTVQAVNKSSSLYYAEKSLPGPVAMMVGRLMRAPYLKWARRTTLDVLSEITENRELIGVLTGQWGDYGLPPAESSFAIHATIAQHYFEGAYYPVGGAEVIARAILPQIAAAGGRVVTNAEVSEILIEGGKATGVRMADGSELHAPIVVSDAGALNTFERLVKTQVPALDGLRREIHALPNSKAHLSLYIGLDRTDAELGLEGTNLWIYENEDHDAAVNAIRRDLNAPFAGVYISFPSAKDPDFQRRCPGKSVIDVVTFVPGESFKKWGETKWHRRGEEYEALKKQLGARMLAIVEEQVPQIKGHVEFAELSTPLTTKHFMNYAEGEIYGIAATPARYRSRRLGARTPVKNLYLTGQDVASAGVVGAMIGGVLAASVILKGNYMAKAMKGAQE